MASNVHLITAVIKPHRLEEVKVALQAKGVQGITITEVKGYGRQGGHTETYRGAEYTIDFLPKIRLEVLCTEPDSNDIVETIASAARTGKIGDGKIWVSELQKVLRVRTGEQGQEALS